MPPSKNSVSWLDGTGNGSNLEVLLISSLMSWNHSSCRCLEDLNNMENSSSWPCLDVWWPTPFSGIISPQSIGQIDLHKLCHRWLVKFSTLIHIIRLAGIWRCGVLPDGGTVESVALSTAFLSCLNPHLSFIVKCLTTTTLRANFPPNWIGAFRLFTSVGLCSVNRNICIKPPLFISMSAFNNSSNISFLSCNKIFSLYVRNAWNHSINQHSFHDMLSASDI